MGYHPDRFVNPLGEFWNCPKCNLILREPMQICEKSHAICSSCSSSYLLNTCPASGCNGAVLDESARRPDATASRFLSSQPVRCANNKKATEESDDWCGWVGPLAEENMHATTCAYAATECPHTGCTFRAHSSLLSNHLHICPFRLVRCPNANLSSPGGHPRKGCSYRGNLNTMDQHLSTCGYNPCPQAGYGCQFTSTLAVMEQHASECKDLLLSELCELRRQVASQQPSALFLSPSTLPSTEGPHTMNTGDMPQQLEQDGHAPLLMTPPSTALPSSDHETGGNDIFGATVICGDGLPRDRSSSILNLDVEGSLDNLQMDDIAKNYSSDEEMEDGELGTFEEDSTLIVETAGDEEEEQVNEDASAEEDVLKTVGIKTELVEESPAVNLKSRPELQAPAQLPNSSAKKAAKKPRTLSRPVSVPVINAIGSSPAVLGYGYMEDDGHIVPVSHDYHALVKSNPLDSAYPTHQSEKIARNNPQQAMPKTDTFGPIRNNMHRRSEAISYGKGSHPYANNLRYPRLIPPPPPVYAGPNPHPASWYPPANAVHHSAYPSHGTYPILNQHPGQSGQRGPAGYRGLSQNLPPRPHWAAQPYEGGNSNHGIPHSRGYPSQMHQDFDSEGFEASRAFFARDTQASSRRPFSAHQNEADYPRSLSVMHTYGGAPISDSQLGPLWNPYHPLQYFKPFAPPHVLAHPPNAAQAFPITPPLTISNHPSVTPTSSRGPPINSNQRPNLIEPADPGQELEAPPAVVAKSESPLVISVPPQKRPPKVSASPLKKAEALSSSQEQPKTKSLPSNPSTLLLPPIHLVGKRVNQSQHTGGVRKHLGGGTGVSNTKKTPKLARSSVKSPPNTQTKLSRESLGGDNDQEKKAIRRTKAKAPTTNRDDRQSSLSIDRSGSSPTKRSTGAKTRYAHVSEEEYVTKETLMDRPPVVFQKRVTRSGKELHSEDEEEALGADSPELDVATLKSQEDYDNEPGVQIHACQPMETIIRSPSGIKTRGIKSTRGRGGHAKSTAKLARPIFYDGTPLGRPVILRNASEGSESSDDDMFVPNGRTATKTNAINTRGRGRSRGRGRGRGSGRGRTAVASVGPSREGGGESSAGGVAAHDRGLFDNGSTASNLSFPVSHSRTTIQSTAGASVPTVINPSRLLAERAEESHSSPTESSVLMDFLAGIGSPPTNLPNHSVVANTVAPSSTWDEYALTGQLGTGLDSGVASSMDFDIDVVEDEWTYLADYQHEKMSETY